jgi:hypothetical protein
MVYTQLSKGMATDAFFVTYLLLTAHNKLITNI